MTAIAAQALPIKPTWPASLNRGQVVVLQRELNKFFKTYLSHMPPQKVDGKIGPSTRKRIRLAKFYLGQVKPGRFSYKVNRQFLQRLRQPKNGKLVVGKNPAKTIKRGNNRRRQQRKLAVENHNVWDGKPSVAMYDGIPVADYFVPINTWCRAHGWGGHVVSGLRTKQYSQHLCYAMCGAPACPGRCAGVNTNHVGINPAAFPHGAEDVTDYVKFGEVLHNCPFAKLHCPRIFNALPIDPVHFSPTGN